MEKEVIVAVGTNCQHKRDNNLGLYCRLGSRKLKRVKKNGREHIICLDCDEQDTKKITLRKKGPKNDN